MKTDKTGELYATNSAATEPGDSPSAAQTIGVCAWILLVAIGFWGPYLRLPISMPLLTGLYGLFVVLGAASVALRYLRRDVRGSK